MTGQISEQIVEKHPSIDSFAKGLNIYQNEQIIGIDEATIAENVDVRNGSLKRCNGYTAVNVDPIPLGEKKLMGYYGDDGVEMMVAVGNEIYARSNGNFIRVHEDVKNKDFTYCNYEFEDDQIIIMGNGEDELMAYNGEGFAPLKFMGGDSDEDEEVEDDDGNKTPNRAPNGKYVALHKERIWTAGVKGEKDTVFHSASFDIHDWTMPDDPEEVYAHGGMIVVRTWDGGDIIGIRSLFDDLVIFKEKNVFRVFGTYAGNFSLIQVFDTVDGVILHNTISSLENTAIWASTKGIHAFNGTNSEVVSFNIKDYFDRMTPGCEHKAVATISDKRYILSIAVDGSQSNNLIIEYDMEQNSFITKTDHNATSFVDIGNQLYFANEEGVIFKYGVGDTYNGKPIHMIWQNGFNSFGEQQARKILNRIYFTAKGEDDVKITSITENKEVSKTLPLKKDLNFFRERLRNKGRFIKLRVENVNGGRLELNQLQFMLDFDYD